MPKPTFINPFPFPAVAHAKLTASEKAKIEGIIVGSRAWANRIMYLAEMLKTIYESDEDLKGVRKKLSREDLAYYLQYHYTDIYDALAARTPRYRPPFARPETEAANVLAWAKGFIQVVTAAPRRKVMNADPGTVAAWNDLLSLVETPGAGEIDPADTAAVQTACESGLRWVGRILPWDLSAYDAQHTSEDEAKGALPSPESLTA